MSTMVLGLWRYIGNLLEHFLEQNHLTEFESLPSCHYELIVNTDTSRRDFRIPTNTDQKHRSNKGEIKTNHIKMITHRWTGSMTGREHRIASPYTPCCTEVGGCLKILMEQVDNEVVTWVRLD